VIAKEAISKVLMRRPKENQGYDPQTALAISERYQREFEADLLDMANADENLYRISATIQGEDLPFYTPGGALWDAQHAVMSGGGANDW
jgi:hypothetical protein